MELARRMCQVYYERAAEWLNHPRGDHLVWFQRIDGRNRAEVEALMDLFYDANPLGVDPWGHPYRYKFVFSDTIGDFSYRSCIRVVSTAGRPHDSAAWIWYPPRAR